jgi:hypothetical protein
MAAAVSIVRARPHRTVSVGADETWIAAPIVDRALAETLTRDLVLAQLTHRDDRDELVSALSPTLVYVPFWRVKLAIPTRHLAPAIRNIAIGNIEFPMPTSCFGGRAGVLMICARHRVPYTPRLPSVLGGSDALEVQRSTLLPMTNDSARSFLAEGEILEADVDRELGERIAKNTLVTLLPPPAASPVRSVFRPHVESTLFVRYPLYVTHFGPDDEHFVYLSARDGSVVSARYPRRPSISERVKRFFNG